MTPVSPGFSPLAQVTRFRVGFRFLRPTLPDIQDGPRKCIQHNNDGLRHVSQRGRPCSALASQRLKPTQGNTYGMG